MISVDIVDAARWVEIAPAFADYTYEQSDPFALAAARRTGSEHLRVEVAAGGVTIGAACVRLKKVPVLGCGIAYILSGPLIGRGDQEQLAKVLQALASHFSDAQGHILRIRLPVLQRVGASAGETLFLDMGFVPAQHGKPYRTVLLDLRLPEAALHGNLHSKWRNQLRRAEKSGLDMVAGQGPEFLRRFAALYAQMQTFKSFSTAVDPAFLQEIGGENFDYDILIATAEGEDVAGHITCATPACSTYVLGATNIRGRALQAGSFLNWQALLRAQKRGSRWFDLGGIDRETNPDGYRFKTRMGGEEKTALGPFDYVPAGICGALVRRFEQIYWAQRGLRERYKFT